VCCIPLIISLKARLHTLIAVVVTLPALPPAASGSVVCVSRGFGNVLGYAHEEVIGKVGGGASRLEVGAWRGKEGLAAQTALRHRRPCGRYSCGDVMYLCCLALLSNCLH